VLVGEQLNELLQFELEKKQLWQRLGSPLQFASEPSQLLELFERQQYQQRQLISRARYRVLHPPALVSSQLK
jgi:hypothetical protein